MLLVIKVVNLTALLY